MDAQTARKLTLEKYKDHMIFQKIQTAMDNRQFDVELELTDTEEEMLKSLGYKVVEIYKGSNDYTVSW